MRPPLPPQRQTVNTAESSGATPTLSPRLIDARWRSQTVAQVILAHSIGSGNATIIYRMAKLIYITNVSLDGFIEDDAGSIGWANPEEIHGFITELVRPIGTYLYGRRLYETMAYWDAAVESYVPENREFARVWQRAEKIVFSRTLEAVSTRNTRVERGFDPEAIRKLKRESQTDITIGGAGLAAAAFEAGLVDECDLFVHPVILGGGKPAFQAASRQSLELMETNSFRTGVVRMRYGVRGEGKKPD